MNPASSLFVFGVCLAAVSILPIQSARAQAPTTEWVYHKSADGAHPSGMEQEMLWLLNRARHDPRKEGIFLSLISQSNVVDFYRFFGVDFDKLRSEFESIGSRPPVAFDRRIWEGVNAHSLDLIARDAQDFLGQSQRIADAGFLVGETGFIGHNVYSVVEDSLFGHAAFNVDWFFSDGTSQSEQNDGMREGRPQRQLELGLGTLTTNIGIAMVEDRNVNTQVGPWITSISYSRPDSSADHYNQFIVGTIWTDTNADGRYNEGEGLGGVTVMPDHGEFYAVTGDAGGFAIPVDDGAYDLRIEGGELPIPENRTVTVAGESVLLDWLTEDHFISLAGYVVPEIEFDMDEQGIFASWKNETDHVYRLETSIGDSDFSDDARNIELSGERSIFRVSEIELDQGFMARLGVEYIPF